MPGAEVLASVEEFKEPLEEGPQQVKLSTPLAEKLSVPCPTLPDPILSLLAPETSALQDGVFVRDGLPTVPKRLYSRMVEWKFIDLAELQPQGTLETVQQEPDQKLLVLPAGGLQLTRSRKKPIKDLSTWIQCFVVYLGVMSKKHPSAVPEMLAYMLTIIRAAQEFEDPAWILYDAAYRDKAAATKNLKWSQIDAGLYNQVFTG